MHLALAYLEAFGTVLAYLWSHYAPRPMSRGFDRTDHYHRESPDDYGSVRRASFWLMIAFVGTLLLLPSC